MKQIGTVVLRAPLPVRMNSLRKERPGARVVGVGWTLGRCFVIWSAVMGSLLGQTCVSCDEPRVRIVSPGPWEEIYTYPIHIHAEATDFRSIWVDEGCAITLLFAGIAQETIGINATFKIKGPLTNGPHKVGVLVRRYDDEILSRATQVRAGRRWRGPLRRTCMTDPQSDERACAPTNPGRAQIFFVADPKRFEGFLKGLATSSLPCRP